MRRIINLISIAFVLLSATGCLHEKYDRCLMDPLQDNVILNFILDDGKGGCRLLSHIDFIDVAVYDGQGGCVTAKNVSQAELRRFKGVTFTLPAGDYSVVAWGNIGENCLYDDMDIIHTAHVTYKDCIDGKVNNADKVFYAPVDAGQMHGSVGYCYEMTVDTYAGHTGTLEFTEGYRTIQIYIEGYEGGMPVVGLAGLPEGLSWFGMNWLTDEWDSKKKVATSLPSTSVDMDGATYAYAEFDTFYFNADNGISVSLTDPVTDDVVFAISINEALGDSFDPAAVTIVIKLKFTASGVEVTIPDWKGSETEPGLGY